MHGDPVVIGFSHFASLLRALEIALRIGDEKHYRPYIEWRDTELYAVNRHALVTWSFHFARTDRRIAFSFRAARMIRKWLERGRFVPDEKVIFSPQTAFETAIAFGTYPGTSVISRVPARPHDPIGPGSALSIYDRLRSRPGYRRYRIEPRRFSKSLLRAIRDAGGRLDRRIAIFEEGDSLCLAAYREGSIPDSRDGRPGFVYDLNSVRRFVTRARSEDDILEISLPPDALEPLVMRAGDSIAIVKSSGAPGRKKITNRRTIRVERVSLLMRSMHEGGKHMNWEICRNCGERRAAEPFGPWEDVCFGTCPRCGCCLGRWMRDPVTKTWAVELPHAFVGNAYYREAIWGDLFCPRCGTIE